METTRDQRSNSTASTMSNASVRSSFRSHDRRHPPPLFASLQQQKRSDDPQQIARRMSLHDPHPRPGVFGRWWNSYVYDIKQDPIRK